LQSGLDADYRALLIDAMKAQDGLHTVEEVLQLITRHRVLAEGSTE
jgi:hypothetical protein